MTEQTDNRNEIPASDVLVPERGLALRWQKSCRTLQRWRATGRGPAWLRLGSSVFYRRSDILAFEEACRTEGHDR